MPKPESQLPSLETSTQPATALWVRLAWMAALFVVQWLYFPLNRMIQGGVVLRIPLLDDRIPLWPIWIIPYLLSLLWWTGCFIWAAWKMEDKLYYAFVIGAISVMLASYVVYLVYPTYVERPIVEGEDWLSDLVRYVYSNDRANNAFPSSHTYTTVLIALFWWRWRPRLRWLWVVIAVIIVLSTLFTGQHHSPDPVGGVIFAWLGYRFGLWWWVDRQSAGEA
jgi:membrane-associated phospholipid phosphatase